MKKINKLLYIFAIAALLFTSCNEDEFLDAEPKGALNSSQLQTPEGIATLVNSAYAGLAQNFTDPNPAFFQPASNWSFCDVRSDDAYKGGGGVGDISEYHDLELGNIRADNFTLERKWKALYVGISRVNEALGALRDVSLEDVPLRDIHIGELRLIRGHFYFDLMKNFGSYVYIDESISFDEREKVPNTFNVQELWGHIEADFLDAIEKLPEQRELAGQANKFAAHAYLCRTYLFQAKWDEAVIQADAVINSGRYGLFSDFTKLWDVDSEHGPEFIWSIEFSTNDGSASGNINWGNLLNTPRGAAYNGDNFHMPSQNLANAYKVDANGLPLFDSFNSSDVTNSDQVDPRLDHTIGRLGIPWKEFKDEVYNETWVRDAGTYGTLGSKKCQIDPTSPYMIKGWPWGGSPLNWPIIKYSDLILMKAEALIQSNQNLEEARSIINSIRERAQNSPYVKTLDGISDAANYKIGLYPSATWTQSYGLQALKFERRLELALEGIRFYDLVRWGDASEVLNTYIQQEASKRTYLNGANFVAGKNEYLPIPQDEIDRSGGIYIQNPAY